MQFRSQMAFREEGDEEFQNARVPIRQTPCDCYTGKLRSPTQGSVKRRMNRFNKTRLVRSKFGSSSCCNQ